MHVFATSLKSLRVTYTYCNIIKDLIKQMETTLYWLVEICIILWCIEISLSIFWKYAANC